MVRVTPVLILSQRERFLNEKMRFVSAGSNNAAAENFRDDLGGFAGAVNAIVGELIGRQALGVERAEAGFIAEKRAAGHGHATGEEDVERRVQPEDGSVRSAKKIRTTGLRVSSPPRARTVASLCSEARPRAARS